MNRIAVIQSIKFRRPICKVRLGVRRRNRSALARAKRKKKKQLIIIKRPGNISGCLLTYLWIATTVAVCVSRRAVLRERKREGEGEGKKRRETPFGNLEINESRVIHRCCTVIVPFRLTSPANHRCHDYEHASSLVLIARFSWKVEMQRAQKRDIRRYWWGVQGESRGRICGDNFHWDWY